MGRSRGDHSCGGVVAVIPLRDCPHFRAWVANTVAELSGYKFTDTHATRIVITYEEIQNKRSAGAYSATKREVQNTGIGATVYQYSQGPDKKHGQRGEGISKGKKP